MITALIICAYALIGWIALGIAARLIWKDERNNTFGFDWFDIWMPAACIGILWPLALLGVILGCIGIGVARITKHVFIPEIRHNKQHEAKAKTFETQAERFYNDYVIERETGRKDIATNLYDTSKQYRQFALEEKNKIV